MVSTPVIHVITWITTHLQTLDGWKAELACGWWELNLEATDIKSTAQTTMLMKGCRQNADWTTYVCRKRKFTSGQKVKEANVRQQRKQ